MLAPADTPLGWAARHATERIAAVGVLALRVRRHLSDAAPPGLAAIPGLRITVPGHPERPLWHESTGLYGFLRLPPGEQRVEIVDPAGLFQAQAVTAQVPDRGSVKQALEAGTPPAPGSPKPQILEVALRPALGLALPPGSSAVWGVVSDGGRPVAGALLGIASVFRGAADHVRAMSGPDGSYLLVLPFETIDRGVSPPLRHFERAVTVHSPRPPLADALARLGFAGGQPADPFSLTPAARDALYRPRDFQLRDSGGALHPQAGGQNPPATVSVGEQVRLDIELLP